MQLGDLGERSGISNLSRKIRNGRISLDDIARERDILYGRNGLIV